MDRTRNGGTAPDFPSGLTWINRDGTPDPESLRGRHLLLHFWSSGHAQSIASLDDVAGLMRRFGDALAVIGVHCPRFPGEAGTGSLANAVRRLGIIHPVVDDRDFLLWHLHGVRTWPTFLLLDPAGRVLGIHAGDGGAGIVVELLLARGLGVHPRPPRRSRGGSEPSEDLRAGPVPPAPSTGLRYPTHLAADARGQRLFVSDSGNHRIVVASPAGRIEFPIGGVEGFADGGFSDARFRRPAGICFDAVDDAVFVADAGNHAIRRISLDQGSVETIAGTGHRASAGPRLDASAHLVLDSPWDLVLEGRTLFVAMAGSNQIWSIHLTSRQARIHAGSGREGLQDGLLDKCALAEPSALATDGRWLYVAEAGSSAVRAVDIEPSGHAQTLVGQGMTEYGDRDGVYPFSRLQCPRGLVTDGESVYVSDSLNHRVKRLDPRARSIRTAFGSGERGHRDGTGRFARFDEPGGLCLVEDVLFVADVNNHCIRACDLRSGRVTTVSLPELRAPEENFDIAAGVFG